MLDGDFNSPQNLLTGLAHRCTQGGHGGGGVPVKDAQKVLVLKIPLRLQPTAGQKGIGGAHGGGAAERRPDVELIIFLQKGTVNDAEDFLLVLLPVVCRQTLRYGL